jgi:hypothetical protein
MRSVDFALSSSERIRAVVSKSAFDICGMAHSRAFASIRLRISVASRTSSAVRWATLTPRRGSAVKKPSVTSCLNASRTIIWLTPKRVAIASCRKRSHRTTSREGSNPVVRRSRCQTQSGSRLLRRRNGLPKPPRRSFLLDAATKGWVITSHRTLQ